MTDLATLACGNVLRAAINSGNRALVRQDGDRLSGVSPALARRLADSIGARLEPVVYPSAGKVFEDAESDRWDVAFLAIDVTRARRVSFTRPYHVIEATYAVRADSAFEMPEDVDRAGMRILTSTGSAYDLFLSDNLAHATLERWGTPSESYEAFSRGQGDAVAGVRASLDHFFDGDSAVRVLPGAITRVEQAMVLPGAAHPAIAALDRFVAAAIAEGFVARELSDM